MTSSSPTSHRTAVLRLHSLGDVILCQPAASLLARGGPVVFLTRDAYMPAVERFGAGITPACVPERFARTAIRRILSEFRPDRTVDLQASLTTLLGTLPARTSRFSTDRALRRLALRGRARMPLRYLEFARTAGFPGSDPPRLQRRIAPGGDQSVGLVCGGRWRLKSIPDGVLAELARLFTDLDGACVTLIGGPGDGESIARVAASTGRKGIRIHDGSGGVGGLLDTLERQSIVISPDSGPAHAARALGVKTLVVFTSTSPALGFWSAEGSYGPSTPCSPCHRHGGALCRLGHEVCRDSLLPLDIRRAALSEVSTG